MRMNTELNIAARAVVLADEAVARLSEPLTAARVALDRVRSRIEHLHAARQAIVQRRQGGDEQADDGSRLALIQADAEGLAELHAEAQAAVTAAEGPALEARDAAQRARSILARAEMVAADNAITSHAQAIDSLLIEVIAKANASAAALGLPYSKYTASPALVTALKNRAIRSGAW